MALNWAYLAAQRLKRLPAVPETWVQSLGREDPLEKEMATHSSVLAWRIPWTEELGRLQSMGLQRVGHDWTTSLSALNWTLLLLCNHCTFSKFISSTVFLMIISHNLLSSLTFNIFPPPHLYSVIDLTSNCFSDKEDTIRGELLQALISHIHTDLYLPMYSDFLLLLWIHFLSFYFLLFSHAAWRVISYFPDQGSNPCPIHWKQGVLTTGQPGMNFLVPSDG